MIRVALILFVGFFIFSNTAMAGIERRLDDDDTNMWRKKYQNRLGGPFLDSDGAWTANADFIYRRNYDGTTATPVALPSDMPSDATMLALVGDKFYFACGQNEDELWCVDKNGARIYSVDTHAPIYRIAVDRSNNVYVSSFYYFAKCTPGGVISWQEQFHQAPERGGEPVFGMPYYSGLPCIGPDNRVFVAVILPTGKIDYRIYGEDGSIYKTHVYTPDDMPVKVARDSSGNIYVVTFNMEVMKFDPELNRLWNETLPGMADDMIIDAYDKLFIAFHVGGGLDFWTIRSMSSDGAELWQITLDDVPYHNGELAWLAIGADGKLIFMTHNAWMAVLESEGIDYTMPAPGQIEPAGSSGAKSLKLKKQVLR